MLRTPPFFPPKSGEKPYLEVPSRFGLWRDFLNNRELKHDVYGRRQTAKITSDYLFSSCNHTKIDKCILLFTTDENIFSLLYRQLKTDGKSLPFVFRLVKNMSINVKSVEFHQCHAKPHSICFLPQ